MTTPVPQADFRPDAGIAPAVRLLRSEGYRTVSSCEGGSGHSFDLPTIIIDCAHNESRDVEDRLIELIRRRGGGATVERATQIRSPDDEQPVTVLRVVFWSLSCVQAFSMEKQWAT